MAFIASITASFKDVLAQVSQGKKVIPIQIYDIPENPEQKVVEYQDTHGQLIRTQTYHPYELASLLNQLSSSANGKPPVFYAGAPHDYFFFYDTNQDGKMDGHVAVNTSTDTSNIEYLSYHNPRHQQKIQVSFQKFASDFEDIARKILADENKYFPNASYESLQWAKAAVKQYLRLIKEVSITARNDRFQLMAQLMHFQAPMSPLLNRIAKGIFESAQNNEPVNLSQALVAFKTTQAAFEARYPYLKLIPPSKGSTDFVHPGWTVTWRENGKVIPVSEAVLYLFEGFYQDAGIDSKVWVRVNYDRSHLDKQGLDGSTWSMGLQVYGRNDSDTTMSPFEVTCVEAGINSIIPNLNHDPAEPQMGSEQCTLKMGPAEAQTLNPSFSAPHLPHYEILTSQGKRDGIRHIEEIRYIFPDEKESHLTEKRDELGVVPQSYLYTVKVYFELPASLAGPQDQAKINELYDTLAQTLYPYARYARLNNLEPLTVFLTEPSRAYEAMREAGYKGEEDIEEFNQEEKEAEITPDLFVGVAGRAFTFHKRSGHAIWMLANTNPALMREVGSHEITHLLPMDEDPQALYAVVNIFNQIFEGNFEEMASYVELLGLRNKLEYQAQKKGPDLSAQISDVETKLAPYSQKILLYFPSLYAFESTLVFDTHGNFIHFQPREIVPELMASLRNQGGGRPMVEQVRPQLVQAELCGYETAQGVKACDQHLTLWSNSPFEQFEVKDPQVFTAQIKAAIQKKNQNLDKLLFAMRLVLNKYMQQKEPSKTATQKTLGTLISIRRRYLALAKRLNMSFKSLDSMSQNTKGSEVVIDPATQLLLSFADEVYPKQHSVITPLLDVIDHLKEKDEELWVLLNLARGGSSARKALDHLKAKGIQLAKTNPDQLRGHLGLIWDCLLNTGNEAIEVYAAIYPFISGDILGSYEQMDKAPTGGEDWRTDKEYCFFEMARELSKEELKDYRKLYRDLIFPIWEHAEEGHLAKALYSLDLIAADVKEQWYCDDFSLWLREKDKPLLLEREKNKGRWVNQTIAENLNTLSPAHQFACLTLTKIVWSPELDFYSEADTTLFKLALSQVTEDEAKIYIDLFSGFAADHPLNKALRARFTLQRYEALKIWGKMGKKAWIKLLTERFQQNLKPDSNSLPDDFEVAFVLKTFDGVALNHYVNTYRAFFLANSHLLSEGLSFASYFQHLGRPEIEKELVTAFLSNPKLEKSKNSKCSAFRQARQLVQEGKWSELKVYFKDHEQDLPPVAIFYLMDQSTIPAPLKAELYEALAPNLRIVGERRPSEFLLSYYRAQGEAEKEERILWVFMWKEGDKKSENDFSSRLAELHYQMKDYDSAFDFSYYALVENDYAKWTDFIKTHIVECATHYVSSILDLPVNFQYKYAIQKLKHIDEQLKKHDPEGAEKIEDLLQKLKDKMEKHDF